MDYLITFLVGGAICALVQVLMDVTKLLPGRIMVILLCLGSILSALGIYKPFAEWAGAGATVPLSGFGNMLFQGVKKAVDTGISGALVIGYIASLVFKSKMKM